MILLLPTLATAQKKLSGPGELYGFWKYKTKPYITDPLAVPYKQYVDSLFGLSGSGSVVAVSGGSTGLNFTAGSTPTMSGVLGAIYGGTGIASHTTGGIIVGTSAATVGEISPGAIGSFLGSNGTSSVPTFKFPPGYGSDATYLTMSGTTANNTPLTLSGAMPVSNGEGGIFEITIYAENAAASAIYTHKVILSYLGASTTINFFTPTDLLPETTSGALSAASWDYTYDGSGDLKIVVTGINGTTMVWRVETKKYSITSGF